MDKPLVFISCGQFTPEEIELGEQIAYYVKSFGFQSFFAQDVHDLNGLHDNILTALRNCAAFITVLHPRGAIRQPDGNEIVRASVWIEQEIAIAAYIQTAEKRPIEIIPFAHKDVHLEGIRTLLNVNPIRFTKNADVIFKLPPLLQKLQVKPSSEIRLELALVPSRYQDSHQIKMLNVTLFNDSNQRILQYNGEVSIPGGALSHWNSIYPMEVRTNNNPSDQRRRF